MPKMFGPFNPFKHNAESGEFNDLTKAYKNNPSTALYVKLRRSYPKALIEIATNAAIDWLFANSEVLESYGIPPRLVAGCLDATPTKIQELSLLLMENLIQREKLESEGVTHVQTRDEIMTDSLINYLITMMLDALDWNDNLHIPRDLIVLIKHQFGADVSAEKRKFEVREKRTHAIWMTAQLRVQGLSVSMRDAAKTMNVSPSTVARWFPEGDFEAEVESIMELLNSDFYKAMEKSGRKFKEEKNKTK